MEVWFNGKEAWPLIFRAMKENPVTPVLWISPYGEDIYLQTGTNPISRVEAIKVEGELIEDPQVILLSVGPWMESMEEAFFFVNIAEDHIDLGTISMEEIE